MNLEERRHAKIATAIRFRWDLSRLLTQVDQPVARRRFVFIAVTHFRRRGTAVARVLAKSSCQVSRLLAAQTKECTLDPTEAAFIDETVTRLLQEGESDDHD